MSRLKYNQNRPLVNLKNPYAWYNKSKLKSIKPEGLLMYRQLYKLDLHSVKVPTGQTSPVTGIMELFID